ncbi:MAG: 50S ribosomal protein L3 [Candidatus Omnitrophica bacterium]|nr:50S ribosomal protein L3 [Candidatus Omnitrophota bacterium]
MPGILGKKVGMTQIFSEDGAKIPVTVVEAGPCVVQVVKSLDKDGYNAVQIGFDDTKEARLKKPQREYVKANKLKAKKFVREIRCSEASEGKIGDEIDVSIFQKGDFLDVTARSKGKGFQGGMKRHGWSGGNASHGSMSHRAPGSIGASSYPSRVFKGQSMAGHMGDAVITVQNVEVIDVNIESNTIVLKGSIPGADGGYLVIKYALKKTLVARIEREDVKEKEVEAPIEEVVETKAEEKTEVKAAETTKENPEAKIDENEDKG